MPIVKHDRQSEQPEQPDAADFYVGRGVYAEYLGSLPASGAPEDIEVWEHFQNLGDESYGVDDFREEVAELRAHTVRSVAHPTPGPCWPWRYPSSVDTPWAYVFDSGTVYVYRYGVEMAAIRCNYTRSGPGGTREPRRPQSATPLFPDMRKVAVR